MLVVNKSKLSDSLFFQCNSVRNTRNNKNYEFLVEV